MNQPHGPRPALAVLLLAAATAAAPVAAQEPGPVTLVFDNGLDGENLSGVLEDYDGQRFLLDSSIGLVAIAADGVSCIGAVCPEGTRLRLDSPRLVLTSLDGTVSVTGNLMEFTDGTYVLATDAGEVRVDHTLVRCEGTGCVASAGPGSGGPVTLTRGEFVVAGTLLGIEANAYVLDVTGFGELRLKIGDYDCEGAGCP